MPDCRVFVNGKYVDPSELEGPTPEQQWDAFQKAKKRRNSLARFRDEATPGMQGSGDLRDRSPRIMKGGTGRIDGVRIR